MRSPSAEVAEAAWGEVYRRYHERVWARVFYVIRTIPWLREPREVASDVTTQVFVGLPAAVARYRDMGRAEPWLLRVALRTAMRHKEALTGNWSDGSRKTRDSSGAGTGTGGRSFMDLEDAVNQVSHAMDEAERDERLELQRRLEAWRTDPAKARWIELVDLFLEGYSHEEIAQRLGITPGTSRTWMWRIRQELARPLGEGAVSDDVSGRDVAGREVGEGVIVLPLRAGAGPHLDMETLERFADGLLEPAEDAPAQTHVAGCALCAEQVGALRLGLAVLALGARPPADLVQRIERSRAAGARPLLPVGGADAGEPLLDEVVGRDAEPDQPDGP